MFQRLGYEADAVENGRAAIACLKTQICVIVTGYSETERVLKALELGVSDRLYKPYTMEDLSMTIQKALKQRSLDESRS